MKKNLIIFLLFITSSVMGQTLSDIQMRNARATGFAIVASRNPGVNFSILMIPWDGVNTLEYNANHQINAGWHAQAAVKGNYFNQEFDGSNFSRYSSVVLSQSSFDIYKNKGSQWWIVCSTLSPYSDTRTNISGLNVGGNSIMQNRVQIGNTNNVWLTDPISGYHDGFYSNDAAIFVPLNKGGVSDLRLYIPDDSNDSFSVWGNTCGGGNCGDLNAASQIIRLEGGGNALFYGNVGIGTTSPDYKLDVVGTIRTQELKVDMQGADFVFEEDYKLRTLNEVEAFVKENKHLPEIAPAAEMQANGVNQSEMNQKLLQKIEELTLYTISQETKLTKKDEEIIELRNVSNLLKERLDRIERMLK